MILASTRHSPDKSNGPGNINAAEQNFKIDDRTLHDGLFAQQTVVPTVVPIQLFSWS